MALTVGVNSWVTVAEANSYLSTKLGASDWVALANATKESCLITAFWMIYSYPSVNIPKTSTNEKVKIAQIELAWWLYNYYEEYEERGALIASGVEDFTLSKWKEKLGSQDLPKVVLDWLDDELINRGNYFPTISREINND